MDVSGISSMLGQTNAQNSATSSKIDSLNNSALGLSSNSTEEEMLEVLKDFESYFLEQIIKKMKDTFSDEDDEKSMAGQYTDTFMDYAIEEVADIMLEEVGGALTQQLFEQMKRNYNIPTAPEMEKAAESVAVDEKQ